MSGTISREIEPPKGIFQTLIRPSTNARATVRAASVSTLGSLNAFIAHPPSFCGYAPKELLNLPAPVLPGSGSTGRRLEDALSASRLPGIWPSKCILCLVRRQSPRPQEPQHRGGVGDRAVRDSLQSYFKRQLHDPYELRRFRTWSPGIPHRPAPEEVADLVGAPGAGVDRDEMLQSHGPKPSLLEELPFGRRPGLLALIYPAARQLQRERTQRLAPLAHQNHLAIFGDGHHRGEPAALEHPVVDGRPVRQYHLVHPKSAPRVAVEVAPLQGSPAPILHPAQYIARGLGSG